jgi:hypothetical protein
VDHIISKDQTEERISKMEDKVEEIVHVDNHKENK